KFELEKIYKTNNHYKVLYSQAAQQILRTVAESFQSYSGLIKAYMIKAYKEEKITDKPRIPNYRKKSGLATVSYPKQALKLKALKDSAAPSGRASQAHNGQIRFSLGKTCKR
ncbi:MAG: hypothetical protein QNJ55_19915, partial [Xenococcus sp. MO_188.B8]|nr:hypothetical protein [Xenococcus sp. MO_188.B8]